MRVCERVYLEVVAFMAVSIVAAAVYMQNPWAGAFAVERATRMERERVEMWRWERFLGLPGAEVGKGVYPDQVVVHPGDAEGLKQVGNLVFTTIGTKLWPTATLVFYEGTPPTTRPVDTVQIWKEVRDGDTNVGFWHFKWEKPLRWDLYTGEEKGVEPRITRMGADGEGEGSRKGAEGAEGINGGLSKGIVLRNGVAPSRNATWVGMWSDWQVEWEYDQVRTSNAWIAMRRAEDEEGRARYLEDVREGRVDPSKEIRIGLLFLLESYDLERRGKTFEMGFRQDGMVVWRRLPERECWE